MHPGYNLVEIERSAKQHHRYICQSIVNSLVCFVQQRQVQCDNRVVGRPFVSQHINLIL